MENPYFCIGHHQTKHRGVVDEETLQNARNLTYDMVTAPITSPAYHSKVVAQLTNHINTLKSSPAPVSSSGLPIESPFPTLAPLTANDTDLGPGETTSQFICTTSTWIDLSSQDPLVADVSRQVLCQEMTYASFCGATHVMVQGPRPGPDGVLSHHGVTLYARSIQEALRLCPFAQIHIQLPIIYSSSSSSSNSAEARQVPGELSGLAGLATAKASSVKDIDDSLVLDHLTSWDVWHLIRNVCRYNTRLSIALVASPRLPRLEIQSRWFSEPARILELPGSCFVANKHDILVLPKTHQQFIARMIRLRVQPWFLLSDVGPLSSKESDSTVLQDPTPSQAATATKSNSKYKSDMPYIEYFRKHIQTKQPPKTPMEKFGQGFQDYLQNPLQPLTDNLESITYEVFEKDPVKYDWYEAAITQALADWEAYGKPKAKSGRVTLVVVGAGRGPLVTRALAASDVAEVPIDIWAVEKNPNAFVLLQRHNRTKWGGRVHLVQTDMRLWSGPTVNDEDAVEDVSSALKNLPGKKGHTTIDILVSELLGSFGDNELSPECLDGVQHLLTPQHGISIPSSYTAHLTPIAAPKLHADVAQRVAGGDADAWEVPYVVMLHSIDYLSRSNVVPTPVAGESKDAMAPQDRMPDVQQAWEFAHPLPPAHISNSQLHDAMGGNAHNARFAKLHFRCTDRGVCHGLAGYFETILYAPSRQSGDSEQAQAQAQDGAVELSINPVTMAAKSEEMISWFPMFFPLETPLYVPDDAELHVSIWRQTDGRKVWYEWLVETFALVPVAGGRGGGDGANESNDESDGNNKKTTPRRRLRLGASRLHSSAKNGCLM